MEENKKESEKETVGSQKQKSITYNSIFNVIYQFLNVVFPFITSIYISHIIQAEGVGKVAYAQNIASYFLTLAPLGVLSYGVKEIAKTKNNRALRNRVFSELFCINFVSTTIFSVLYYSFILMGKGFQEEKLLFLVCGLQIILNYINVDWFYQGMEEFAYITMRSFVIKILSLAALFLVVQNKEDYVLYALITCLAIGGNSIFNIIHIRKYVTFQYRDLRWKKHLRPELILACNILLSNLYSKVDITMLGYWKSDAVTGYYSNAFKIVNLILCVCLAMTDVLLPRLSYSFCENKKKYSELINKGAEVVLFLIIPTTIGLNVVAPVMIPLLFGESFVPAVITVQMLSPLILIKGFGNIACYQVAISSGNEKKQTAAYIAGGLINVFLNWLLIPILDQNGAAIASVASEGILNLTIFMQLRDVSGIKVNRKHLGSIIIGSICMGIIVKFILSITHGTLLYSMIAVAAGMLVYALSTYGMKNKVALEVISRFGKLARKRYE